MEKVPSISKVVAQIGKPGIEYERGLRFDNGDVFTRASKGREFFITRIFQQKKIVDAFEKEIDKRCDHKGVGKKLTKSLGAYERFGNPRLTPEMVEKLEKRAAQVEIAGPPPKGLRAEFDENDNLKWVGRFEPGAQANTKIKSGLAIEFNNKFSKPSHKGDSGDELSITEQCLTESNRSGICLNDGDHPKELRNYKEAELTTELRNYVGGGGRAAYNFSALLTQTVFGDLLLAFNNRTGCVVAGESGTNSLNFKANKKEEQFVVECTSRKKVGVIYDGDKMYYFDHEKSVITESIKLSSDLKTLGDGNAKGVKIVGNPSIDCVLYPIPPKKSEL